MPNITGDMTIFPEYMCRNKLLTVCFISVTVFCTALLYQHASHGLKWLPTYWNSSQYNSSSPTKYSSCWKHTQIDMYCLKSLNMVFRCRQLCLIENCWCKTMLDTTENRVCLILAVFTYMPTFTIKYKSLAEHWTRVLQNTVFACLYTVTVSA